MIGSILHAGHIKIKKSLSCTKTLQKQQAYTEVLKRDEHSEMITVQPLSRDDV